MAAFESDLPRAFWYLWVGTIVNRLGSFVVPFLMLYLTSHLGMRPASAGAVVSLFGAGSLVANLVGGEMADRFGRRPVMLGSFSVAPMAMVALGQARDLWSIILAALILGFFVDLYRPALNAAIIDIIPADKRARAFGYTFWAINFGVAFATILAGFLADIDYWLLFAGDAMTTAVFGCIVFLKVPESRTSELASAVRGHEGDPLRLVLRDRALLIFCLLTLGSGLIYSQAQVTLPLEMAAKGLQPSDYGVAISVNGLVIVLMTLWVSRRAQQWPRYPAMGFSAALLGVGFGLSGIADVMPAFALSVAIWTVGEVISASISPVIVGEISPATHRGLYLGAWGASWSLAYFLGPLLGSLVYERNGPATLWGAVLGFGIVIGVAYLALAALTRANAPVSRVRR